MNLADYNWRSSYQECCFSQLADETPLDYKSNLETIDATVVEIDQRDVSVVDLPLGEWTPFLIGDQWPSSMALEATFAGSAGTSESCISIRAVRKSSITSKRRKYCTAREVSQPRIFAENFKQASKTRAQIAKINLSKVNRMQRPTALRLNFGADFGILQKREMAGLMYVNRSKKPLPEKVGEIVAIITEIRGRAALEAARCAGDINSAIQQVLTVQGVDQSLRRAFAAAHVMGSPDRTAQPSSRLTGPSGQETNQLSNLDTFDSADRDRIAEPEHTDSHGADQPHSTHSA